LDRISDFTGSRAEWVQPSSNHRYFELRAASLVLSSLRFRSAFGTLAEAAAEGDVWTFKRVGFLNTRVTVRCAGEAEDVAVFTPKFWSDGVLAFSDETSLLWRPTNFWATQWAFGLPDGGLLLEYRIGVHDEKLTDIFKHQATVEICDAASWRDRLPLLLPLVFYLFLMYHEDAAAGEAAEI
jgi:hypothetical protein